MVGNINDLVKKEVKVAGAENAFVKVLVSAKEGWEDYVMRVFELEKNGFTPKHQHPWPHINYIIEGEGDLMIDNEHFKVQAGSYAYVPSDKLHQFRNISDKEFKFICIVPKEGHK
jgi:quercetin dioxygenase-like cupin family protein